MKNSINVVLLLYMICIPTSGQLVYSNGTVQCGANIKQSIQNDTECDWKLTILDKGNVPSAYGVYSNVLTISYVDSAAECLETVRHQCPWANIAAIGNVGVCYCVYKDNVTVDSNIQSNDTSFADGTSYFSCSFRDHDWNTMNVVYDCPVNHDINEYLHFTVCREYYDINYEDISHILNAYTLLSDLGLGLQDPSVLLLLVSMNVLVGLFVVHGLHQLGDDASPRGMSFILAVILWLLATSFLVFVQANSSCLLMFGSFSNSFAQSWRHFVAFSFMVAVSIQWTYHHEKVKKRKCLASPLWWSVILSCILILCSMLALDLHVVPLILYFLMMTLLPLALCRISERPVYLRDHKICKSKCCLFFVVILVLWYKLLYGQYYLGTVM